MKHAKTLAISGILLAGARIAGESAALAQGGIPLCSTVASTYTKVIYMGGTTAVLPVIKHFGAQLKQAGVLLLWNESTEGCSAVANIVSPPKNLTRPTFSHYDEVAGAASKITISNCIGGLDQVPDLVINDTYWTSCFSSYGTMTGGAQPLNSNFKEFLGPVQGLVPIVATTFYYDAMTVDELLDVYACGAKANILTFTDNSTIFNYDGTISGMRELWARGLGASNGQVTIVGSGSLGITAESMVDKVDYTTSPDTTIGYTSTEFYDESRDVIRALKVRGVNQLKAYLPDTDSTSLDKINIREGRYTIQGALKFVTQVDSTGMPTNDGAKKIIYWMQGNPLADPLPFDINEIYAQRGVVPQCAMRVTKDSDLPVFRHYTDPSPCHCSFEMLATGKTSCTPCSTAAPCATGQCSHGYCE
jgi:ABC-type phosphate transport system substrate-binding protein